VGRILPVKLLLLSNLLTRFAFSLQQRACSKLEKPKAHVVALDEWLQDPPGVGIYDTDLAKSVAAAGMVARALLMEGVDVGELRPPSAAGRKRSCSEISISETLDGEYVDFSLLAEDSDTDTEAEQESDDRDDDDGEEQKGDDGLSTVSHVPGFAAERPEETQPGDAVQHTTSVPRVQQCAKRQRTNSSTAVPSSAARGTAVTLLQTLSRADRELLQRFSELEVLQAVEQLLCTLSSHEQGGDGGDGTFSEEQLALALSRAEIDRGTLSVRLSKSGKLCVTLSDGLHRKLVYILCRLYAVRACGEWRSSLCCVADALLPRR
jgi:hypothetical protein